MKTEIDFWRVKRAKFLDRARGRKFYRASLEFRGITRFLRLRFDTASDAEQYGLAVIARYKRLLAVAEGRL